MILALTAHQACTRWTERNQASGVQAHVADGRRRRAIRWVVKIYTGSARREDTVTGMKVLSRIEKMVGGVNLHVRQYIWARIIVQFVAPCILSGICCSPSHKPRWKGRRGRARLNYRKSMYCDMGRLALVMTAHAPMVSRRWHCGRCSISLSGSESEYYT